MRRGLKAGGAILLALVVFMAAGFFFLKQWANQPVDGKLRSVEPADPRSSEAPKTPTTPTNIQNNYFSAELPAGFTVKRQTDTQSGRTLLQLAANNKQLQVSITIATLPAEGLPGVGDYNLRIKDTARYQPHDPPGIPAGATAFRSTNNPPAFVVFWPHGGRYAEIALTSDSTASLEDLNAAFAKIIQSWQWQ